MEFKQLYSFIAVVKYRSFTKAAESLFISQPTISTHLRMLEEEYQCRLIIRTTKNIEVTKRGWELYECAVGMIALKEKLDKQWSDESKKTVSIGASTIPSSYILPEVLPIFKEMIPDIQFSISQSDSQGIIEGLQKGQYEMGIVGMKTNAPGIEFESFYNDHMIMITPYNDDFLKYKQNGEKIERILLNHPLLLREHGSGSQKCIDQYLVSIGLNESKLQVIARLNEQETIKKLVASNLGISIISAMAAKDYIEEKKILAFELNQNAGARNLYLIYRKNDILKSHTVKFIEFLKNRYI